MQYLYGILIRQYFTLKENDQEDQTLAEEARKIDGLINSLPGPKETLYTRITEAARYDLLDLHPAPGQ